MKFAVRVIVAALLVALVLAACAAEGNDGAAADGPGDSETQQTPFVGLSLDEAVNIADSEGRPWRVAREDDVDFVLTDDLHPGRVTFEVDAGIVSTAHIEQPNTDPSATDQISEDPGRAALIAAAVLRLSTVDNQFADPDIFDEIWVASTVTSDNSLLDPLDLELIAGSLSDHAQVRFIDDSITEIDALFADAPSGLAAVAFERIELLDSRAELEMRLWCGPMCVVFLTYEAVPDGDGWEIVGTVGGIAVS